MQAFLMVVVAFGPGVAPTGEERGGTPLYAEMPTVQLAGVRHLLPPTGPTEADILAAAGRDRGAGDRVSRIEVVQHRVGEPAFYPLVGVARLSSARFRCEIQTSDGVRVVVVPQDVLVVESSRR